MDKIRMTYSETTIKRLFPVC